MNKQLTDIPMSGSAWQLLDKLDTTLNSKSPLAEKLQDAICALIDSIHIDAVWCTTISPLPSLACGVIRTPTSMDVQAKITIVDRAPSLENNPAFATTPLMQVINGKNPDCILVNNTAKTQIDADLCDASFGTFHITPLAIVPVVAKNGVLGAMVAGVHKNGGGLSTEQHSLLLYLGKHIGQYLYNAYLAERAIHHANTLDTLNQISRTITSSLDIDDVIQKTMAGINTLLNVEAGSLLLQDPNTQELYFKVTLRGENKRVTSYRLQPDEGVAGWVVANNQATIVNQPATDNRFTNKIDRAIGFTTQNILCVPLVVRGKSAGALELINKRSGPFTDDDQELLVSMAASLGVALNNALLYEDARTRAQQNEVFNQITTAINSGHGLSDTATLIFNQFGRLFTFDHISFSLIDTLNNKIKQWTFDDTGSTEETGPSVALEESKLAQIVTEGQGFIENDLAANSLKNLQYPDQAILQNHNISSIIAVPLATQTTRYGCLCLGSKQNNIYGITQLNTLEKFAPQIAVVLDKALLIDATEKRAAEMQQLNRLGEMLSSTVDLKLIIDTTVTMLPRILSSEIHGVVIAGEEGAYAGLAVPSGFWQKDPIVQEMFNTLLELQAGPVPTELITIKTIVTNLSVTSNWKPETNLILPILTRQGTQGVIYTASAKSEIFGDDFLRVFSLIVSQISAAVENALLFQQIEQERARLAAILASTTDAVLVVNRKGRIVLDNPAARKLIKATESQRGRLLTESTTLQPLIRLFENAVQGGKTSGEIPLTDNRTFFASLSPVSTGEAGTIGWVATMQDVSHFKELDDLKNEFIGTVSHDLRSPLSSILIATKLIEQAGETNADQQQMISLVERRVQGMSELIDDLLDVGHIEAGVDMNLEPCDVAAIVDDVTTELLSQANDKEIQLTTTITENIPAMLANETRLQQVVHNLVGNAIKYTPDGGTVTVKAYPHKNEVRMQVIDTGMGIPASDQPHIFEKFYRVRGEHVLEIKGTGLGLAIVKSIVDKLNGRIWLESVFGKGSTFTVAFPVSTDAKMHMHRNIPSKPR